MKRKLVERKLVELYLDWVNNWATLSGMADHYNIDIVDLDQLIDIGRKLHERNIKNHQSI